MAEDNDITSLTAEIVGSYVAANKVAANELAGLISSVHSALSGAGKVETVVEPDTKATPSQIRKSLTPDALISFVDGKAYKSLKRHLSTQGMSPDEYRTKFGLPKDYPMVAPSYSAQRSELAKKLGLGNKRAPEAAAPQPAPTPAKRGRKPKAQPEQTQQAQKGEGGAVRPEDESFS